MKVELLFPCSWWDGPISGLCIYKGEICWFAKTKEDWNKEEEEWHNEFTIYRLSNKEKQFELRYKALFEKYVGTHWSFDIPAKERRVVMDHTKCKENEYYKARSGYPDYSGNDVLGVITEFEPYSRRRRWVSGSGER